MEPRARSRIGYIAGSAVFLMALLGACGVPTEPAAPADLNVLLGMMSLSMVPHASEQLLTPLPKEVGRTLDSSHCAFAASSRRFVCEPFRSATWSDTSTFTLLDANGVPQSAYDPSTTASIQTDMAIGFAIDRPGKVRQLLTLTGLRERSYTLSGGQTVIFTPCTARSCSVYGDTLTVTLLGVVLPPLGSATPWPSAGTLTFEQGGESDRLIFNGTSSVPVVESGALGTRHCRLDLTGTSWTAMTCPRYF